MGYRDAEYEFLVMWRGQSHHDFKGATRIDARDHREAAEKRLSIVNTHQSYDGDQLMTLRTDGSGLLGGILDCEIHTVQSIQPQQFAHRIK